MDSENLAHSMPPLLLGLAGTLLSATQSVSPLTPNESVASASVGEESVSTTALAAMAQVASSTGHEQGITQSQTAAIATFSDDETETPLPPTVSQAILTSHAAVPDEAEQTNLVAPTASGIAATHEEPGTFLSNESSSNEPVLSSSTTELRSMANAGQPPMSTDEQLVPSPTARPPVNADIQEVGEKVPGTDLDGRLTVHQTAATRADRAASRNADGNDQPPVEERVSPTGRLSDSSSGRPSFSVQAGRSYRETEQDSTRSFQQGSSSLTQGDPHQVHHISATSQFNIPVIAAGHTANDEPAPSADQATPVLSDAGARAVRLDREASTAPPVQSVHVDMPSADLGQLRVRIVLSDQTVHTHVRTDSPELGHLLASRQDQLGAQLSASGLEMGHFRVQVDRQGANHSGQEWLSRAYDDAFQRHQGHRQQDRPPDSPVPSWERTGVLSLFA